MEQRLEGRTAVIHGGGGAIGGAVAKAFAREGARVFLAGRTRPRLREVADEIVAAGGRVEVAAVDALDEGAAAAHAAAVAERAGGIDVLLNAVGVDHVQGVPLAELSLADFAYPIEVYTRSAFVTAKAAAPYLARRRGAGARPGTGLVLNVSPPGARLTGPGFLGHVVACAGVEAMTRHLAGELAPDVRVVCIRSHAIPDAMARSYTSHLFRRLAAQAGVTVEQQLAGFAEGTLLRALPTLAQLAETAVYLASPAAGAMTGAVVNLTSGFTLD
jgi:NAD(P)-dependent dehydrogenase (short-subunit alcohol dehydrogenase family)